MAKLAASAVAAVAVLALGGAPSVSVAATMPAYSGVVNAAISSSTAWRLGQLGWSVTEIGTALRSLAIAETLVTTGSGLVAAATSWPVLLGVAGAAVLLTYSSDLGVDGKVQMQWQSPTGPLAQLSGSGMPSASVGSLPVIPSDYPTLLQQYGTGNPYLNLWFSQSGSSLARNIRTVTVACPGGSPLVCGSGQSLLTSNTAITLDWSANTNSTASSATGYYTRAYSTQTSTTGSTTTYSVVYDQISPSGKQLSVPAYTPAYKSPRDVVTDIPAGYTGITLSDVRMAELQNALWGKVAEAGLEMPRPMPAWTVSDTQGWRLANPTLAPTVGDYISPIAPPGSNSVPVPIPGTNDTAGASSPSVPGTTVVDSCSANPSAAGCAAFGDIGDPPDLPSSAANVSLSPMDVGPLNGQCPADVTVMVFGSDLALSYGPICTVAASLRPVVLMLCAVGAALIFVLGLRS
ncbi:hypothetical protein LGM65_26970 [Burkholderia anthina]|uniref:virulence factor TspB C-terminal domain-related protein n=1 Tax=Burkholderia anthina TaxID=179879 RepID=UPI001CF13759|nr:virulence factor TspB C-terminal domain-related protein [Burkholderia anthina]MCA8094474.1 hypothetical protein [Burkholderia anthina]